jgi:hypothetical protein
VIAEPLHARVAGWLERAFNPILVKELRGSFRGARFFVAHMAVLTLFAAGLLVWLGVTMAEARHVGDFGGFVDPSRVGQKIFLVTQLLHLGVVFLVVPGLAATSITLEREALTHDLLVTTTLRARQIVWGKFTAALFQTFTLFVSMVPLVGLTFFFGGITVYQIVANYVFLMALSALVVAFALFVSSHAGSTQRAVAAVYGVALLGGGFAALLLGLLGQEREELAEAAALAYGFVSPGPWMNRAAAGLFDRVLYVHVVPGFVAVAFFGLFFINAVNRLKPLYANRSTNLRTFSFLAAAGLVAIVVVAFRHELPADTGLRIRADGLTLATAGSLIIGLIASFFACEDAVVPAHLVRSSRRFPFVLRPGGGPGAAFAALLSGLAAAGLFAGLLPLSEGFNRGAWSGLPAFFPWALACGTVATWGIVCALFGRWLSAALPGRPLLVRTLLVSGALALALAPWLHWTVAREIERDLKDPNGVRGPITLVLSPVASVLSALDLSSQRREFPLTAAGIPVPAGHTAVSVLLAALLLVLGNRSVRARGAETASQPPPA